MLIEEVAEPRMPLGNRFDGVAQETRFVSLAQSHGVRVAFWYPVCFGGHRWKLG